MNYNIVSADSHINEPPDLFKNLPGSLKDLAPRVESFPKGDAWIMKPGAEPRFVSTSAVIGRKKEEYLSKPVTYADMAKGSFLPEPRLKDMDTDHIDAEVLYPGIMRYTERIANPEVRMASCQVYNEWIADFAKYNPKRLAAIGVVPMLDDNDGENSLKCLKEAQKLGLPSVFLSQKEPGMPLHHPAADKFWAAASDMQMPISIHIYTNPFTRGMPADILAIPGTKELGPSTVTMSMAEHLVLLIFGGVFQRHPKLKVVLAEGGIGWIPALLERMDHVFHVHRPYLGSPITELPSETFKKHCYATFQFDAAGIALRNSLGVENLMWASDYPHTDTTWPESKQTIDRIFAGVPAAEKQLMVAGNAARLYGFSK